MTMTDLDTEFNTEEAGYLDLSGVVASSLCALHCVLMPVLAASLPVIGLGMLADEKTETALLGTSATLATVSIGLGYLRHRSGRVGALVAAGLCLLALGRFVESRGFEWPGVAAIVAGGLAVAGSHLLNRRLCRSCPKRREARPVRGGRLAHRIQQFSTPAAPGAVGGAVSDSRGGSSDPGADRRSASFTSIP